MVISYPAPTKGTFEYIEAKIRLDAEGTAFGADFEWLCQWFLENAPRYRGRFEQVWLWKDWPDRWGTDAGIDLIARTRTGELWAIQAKADHPDRAITKREIDSFLSESNRSQFAYRLLMATTDDIGATARRTLHNQEKPVGLVLRGHFLTEQIQWPVQIGGTAATLCRHSPQSHQATAIDAVVNGFQDHDRGQLIMACGTGKTLTALWIAERMQSSLTLVLVPSLSLVQQNLAEWGRHAAKDFDTLVVCSDESVVQSKADSAIQSAADLGVKVTTKPEEIRKFLAQRRKRSAVVFATYQSSNRIAAAQAGKVKPFDLVICDEAHRLAGHIESLFATVLNGKKIKARKRLFMTATPRYFKEHLKRRAAEQEFELVSMDDAHVFGPEFHVLTFHEAISAKPPLLTDYQVVVIGVTDREAKAWAEEARLVRTVEGLSTDARMLAAQIGLAKAMKKYDLRKIITFHSSVAKAARFVDATQRDSLPGVIPHLTRSAKPSGKLWTKHISGHTPAGQRATLLKGLGNLSDDTRGILSNCACLGEGVDVPVLDGVAFIDPKRSMVDIIQAVGRVIRKAAGKQIGTIVIPVFIDETEDADHILSQSAFEPVWQVLKALRAHDRRLADELDQLRLSLRRRPKSGGRISLPDNIHLDVPRLLLSDFEQAFYVRTVKQTTSKPRFTIEKILAWADSHFELTGHWPNQKSGSIIESPDETWLAVNHALSRGMRGLVGGSSLAQLFAKHRGIRNRANLPVLTIEQILLWADAHHRQTGEWPKVLSGIVVDAPNETWSAINAALEVGLRGLPGKSSIARLLRDHRKVRNRSDTTPLSVDQILAWADAHHARMSVWPKEGSGKVLGASGETWGNLSAALRGGLRGLPGGSSLAQILAEHRDVRNVQALVPLTIEQILSWTDSHHKRLGQWPRKNSGPIFEAPGEIWTRVDNALVAGLRGLPVGSSLAKLLDEKRGVRNLSDLAPLTEAQILLWADEHHARTGEWPKIASGAILTAPSESWGNVNQALVKGLRQLRSGSSLAKLLADERNVRNHHALVELTIEQILGWAGTYFNRMGQYPNIASGAIDEVPGETWSRVNAALSQGCRGLPNGSSLAKLLSEKLGVRNAKKPPPLTTAKILEWADAHFRRAGKWPKKETGVIHDAPGETWNAVNVALVQGLRELNGGSSISRLLAQFRGVRNLAALPALVEDQIIAWADSHYRRTGQWPNPKTGSVVEAAGESWNGIQVALANGRRGLPGGSSLAKLLDRQSARSDNASK